MLGILVGGATGRFVGMAFIALGVVCFFVLFYLQAVVRAMRRVAAELKRYSVVLAFLVIGGLWLYSHLFPESLGTCHEIPMNLGANASIRECQAYGTADFIVPLALVVLTALLLDTADIEFTIPGLGTVKRKREGEKAAEVLKQETDTLDERGVKFLDTLPTSEKPPP